MVFGDHVTSAESYEPAAWLTQRESAGAAGVRGLIPDTFEAFARLWAPEPDHPDEWWEAYRRRHDVVATVGARHTSTPEQAWFAIWEGHGWQSGEPRIATSGPIDDERQARLDAELAQLRTSHSERVAAMNAGLAAVTTFELPHRRYYLLSGPVSAATKITPPVSPGAWQRPDLWWPDDRAWMVATDVDFWSLYVGGTAAFIAELIEAVPEGAEQVDADYPVEPED